MHAENITMHVCIVHTRGGVSDNEDCDCDYTRNERVAKMERI